MRGSSAPYIFLEGAFCSIFPVRSNKILAMVHELGNAKQKVFAPVLICTYTRCSHLKKTIEALANNSYALSTDLYIASDYPYDESHQNMVNEVRDYIGKINGFKSVNVILRDRNFGANANYYDALDNVFEKHDRVIIMEDDIVTGRYFLKFINDGLDFYGPNGKVLAVGGYMWPKLQAAATTDTLLLPHYNAWGTGFHKENFRKIKSDYTVSQRVIADWRLFLRANLLSPGISLMLIEMARGKLHAWDVDCFLYMLEHDLLMLFPRCSFVKNIGFDGTGIHCGVDLSFDDQIINDSFPVGVKDISPEEISLCQKMSFKAFGGWRIFLKGLVLFYLKKNIREDHFVKMMHFKQRLMFILRLR